MNYETFLNMSADLSTFVENHHGIFIDFSHCLKAKIIREDDVDYFQDLRKLYWRSRPTRVVRKDYIDPQILICAIIIVRYPEAVFENAITDCTKLQYLSSSKSLLERAKALNNFMMTI